MAHSRYFIFQHNNHWLIEFDGQECGPYKSKAEAMLFAIDAAHKFGKKSGIITEVCLRAKNGRFRPKWTFGQYPYPDPALFAA